MNLSMCEVPVHPVEHLTADNIAILPELPMTQAEDGTYFCDGESTQDGTPSPDNPIPITNTYPAGTYKAICGDKTYKVVLDDDLRSVPNVSDRVVIDAGRGKLKIEKGIGYIESYTDETVETVYMSSTGELTEGATVIYQLSTRTTHKSIPTQLLTIQSGRSAQILNTVNDKADFLKVRGDSWQKVQDEIKDADGNVTQPKMPSPEYQSEIKDVDGTLQSSGWNLFDVKKAIETATGGYQDKTYFKFDNGKTYNISCISRVESYSIWLAISATGFNSPIENAKLLFSSIGKVSMTVTIPDDGCEYYLYLCYSGRPSNSQYMNFFNGTLCEDIQITSKTHHPYDRHRGNSITLPTLRGLPDGTRDALYVDRKAKRAWVERKVGEFKVRTTDSRIIGVIFTAGMYDSGNSTNVAFILNDIRLELLGNKDITYCNCLSHGNYIWSVADGVGYCFNENQIHMRFPNTVLGVSDDAISAEKKQAWIDYVDGRYDAGNPIIVYYPLATPVTEELPYSDYMLDTCQWETNISFVDCNENLNPKIEVGCKVLGR